MKGHRRLAMMCVAASTLALSTACDSSASAHRAQPAKSALTLHKMAVNDHGGIVVGLSIDETPLPCNDGQLRVIAPRKLSQLITFTSVGDCSACEQHLAGLDSLSRLKQLPVPHVYVAYSAPSNRSADSRAYASVISDPVCWDEKGALWDEYNISHTPVSVLVFDGRVLLMHDTPLVAAEDRQRLIDTVRAVQARGR